MRPAPRPGLRAALYARYSDDQQNPASVADQLHACRRHALQLGAVVVAEFQDEAISGAATGNRPGILALMRAAQAAAFDLVIAEDLSRLARSGGDTWYIYEDLEALGIPINTIEEQQVGELEVMLKGGMNALTLRGLRHKTRRGLEGVVRSGRSAGGRAYGYQVRREYDGRGEPIRGLLDVVAAEADVVRRIFDLYAGGMSPKGIAARLNLEAVPGPTGGAWNASTIAGNAKRGNGVLHNELYRGVRVFGRHAWSKDRRSGARRARPAAADQVLRLDAPDLRIVPEGLWEAVRARYAEATRLGRPEGARRPKRLLSGLLRCGCCGGAMNLTGPGGALRCHNRVERGPAVCTNSRTPAYAGVEARVLAAIEAQLLHPEVIEAALTAAAEERRKRSKGDHRRRQRLEADLAEVKRRASRLLDFAGDDPDDAVREKLQEFRERRRELEAAIVVATACADPVDLHPASPRAYRRMVEQLQAALKEAEGLLEAGPVRELLRELIREVQVFPLAVQGQYRLEIRGDLAILLESQRATPVSGSGPMPTLGAGTRVGRSHKARRPFELAA